MLWKEGAEMVIHKARKLLVQICLIVQESKCWDDNCKETFHSSTAWQYLIFKFLVNQQSACTCTEVYSQVGR